MSRAFATTLPSFVRLTMKVRSSLAIVCSMRARIL
jgi:hypothetical protein